MKGDELRRWLNMGDQHYCEDIDQQHYSSQDRKENVTKEDLKKAKWEISATADLNKAVSEANAADAACVTAMQKAETAWGVVHFCKAKFENQENWRVKMSQDQVILSPRELWMQQAPSFNFELDQEQLVKHALEVGFVTKLNDNTELLVVNPHYGE